MAITLDQRIAMACRLNGEFPLLPLHDRPALQKIETKVIPSQCFQTAEMNHFGRSHHASLMQLRARNPDIHWLLFDAHRRDAYMAEFWGQHPISDIYRRARFGAMRADIFRYCIIFDQGGFYLDINKLLNQPLSQFAQSTDHGLISFENNWCQLPATPKAATRLKHPDRYVVQWGFGFCARHEILRMMISNICLYSTQYDGKILRNPSEAIRSLTGPGLFTQTIRQYFEQGRDDATHQAGIDFNDQLRCPSEREVMYLQRPHYKSARDEPILEPLAA